jgi:rod shape-determining protein MreC
MPNQRKYAFFALVTLCVCVLALYIHRHRQGQTGKIDNALISVAGGVQKTFFYFTQGTRQILDHYLFLVNAQKQNDELRKELDLLRTKLTQLQEVELENARLRDALEFRSRAEQPLLAAHVVAHDVSADYFGVRVDKGAKQGVRVGMGVISPSGLVGRVLRVAPNYSDVLTLVDPTSNIDGIIQRSRARGIISGQAKQLTCRMKYLDRLEDVAVNDVVVSSGFGNIFPKGLLVGYVTSVVPSPNGILQNVTVKSAVDIYRLEEVFIVFPPAEPEKTT